MKNAIILALVFCALTVGCVSNSVIQEVNREYEERYPYMARIGLWFVDRMNDASDVFQVTATGGFGGGPLVPLMNVHITELGQVGMGWFEGYRLGWQERAFGVWTEKRSEWGIGPLYQISVHRETQSGGIWPLLPFLPGFVYEPENAFKHEYDYTGLDIMEQPEWKEDNHHWADIGFAFHLYTGGLDINFKTGEFVDFVAGWSPLGLILTICEYYALPWDVLYEDDLWYQVRDELEEERNLEGN